MTAAVVALLASCIVVAAMVAPVSAQSQMLTNGDFEAGTTGWAASGGASFVVDGAHGSAGGENAARVTATGTGVFWITSQWWVTASVVAGAGYRLEGWLLQDDPLVSRVGLRLAFLDADGSLLLETALATSAGEAATFRHVTLDALAPAGAVHVRAVVEGVGDAPGAAFSVDEVVLTQVTAPPPVTPTVQPAPTSVSPPPAAPAPTATVTRTPTPSPTPTPRLPGPAIWNGQFHEGTDGWDVRAGSVSVGTSAGGAPVLLLEASSSTTAWVEQRVLATAGDWFEAQATLAPMSGVSAAWLRIAWYASADGSGAQMSTVDSAHVRVVGLPMIVQGVPAHGEVVTTGAVRAPAGVQSARVRILLQPTMPGAVLAIGDVQFLPASPPPIPTPIPTPEATPAPPPAAGAPPPASPPPAAPPAGGTSPSRGATGAASAAAPPVDATTLAAQAWLRMTEVMPDPPPAGPDWEYEWVELTNLGPSGASTAGMLLRDRSATTPLPPVNVAPGASIIVSGPLADVDADIRLSGPIGNGLGNQGDRLELVDGAGSVVDALEYGAGSGIAAPSVGLTLQRWFEADGRLAGMGIGAPRPGVHGPLPVSDAEPAESGAAGHALAASEEPSADADPPVVTAGASSSNDLAWALLLAVGGGALGGVLMQQIASRRRASGVGSETAAAGGVGSETAAAKAPHEEPPAE